MRRRLAAAFVALWAAALGYTVLTLSGLGATPGTSARATDLVYVAVTAAAAVPMALRAHHVGSERAAWWWLTASMVLFALGNGLWDLLYFGLAEPPYPSWADAAWIAYYVPAYAGIALLIRARLRDLPRAAMLDGLISALGVAALSAGLVLSPIVAGTSGAPLMVLVNLAYPIGDLALLALCAATLALTRGRPGRAWLLLVAGFAAYSIADTAYLFQSANGTYVDGGPLDLLWVVGMVCIAFAAWQRPQPAAERVSSAADHVVPALFAGAAVALLAYGAAAAPLPVGAVCLAIATVVVTTLRLGLVVREVQHLAESRRLAESDDLTGLLNRRGLGLRLEDALRLRQDTAGRLSLLLLDLNRFKEINDTLGHHAGDQLLQEVAVRLQQCLPRATLARLGGDEFVVLLPCGPIEALAEAARLCAALELPLDLDGLTTHTGASIGIASSPEHGLRRGDLLRHADVAMYRAKQRESGVELYAADGDRNSRERLALAAELRIALLDPNQIVLHYQPQVELDTGRVAGVEALVRWQHPEHGLMAPDRFLDVAEQHALMHDLTLAVIERALRQHRAWRRAGVDLDVSVNVTAADLLSSDFSAHVAGELRRYETPPGALKLELTEKTVMREPGRALDTLAQLAEVGVTLSLDDFGTGYSSLAHLKRLPVQELKVDRSFVMDMLSDRDDAVIVRSTVELGRSLGLRVVAEGVETVEHLDRLRYFGCHVVQGFLVSRPLPAAKVAAWLHERRSGALPAQGLPAGSSNVVPVGARVLEPLLDVAGLITDGAPLAEVLTALSGHLRTVVPHDDLVVYLLDPADHTLSAIHAEGESASETIRERFDAREGITGAALREGRLRNVPRTDLDPDSVIVAGTAEEPEALVCCPMTGHGRSLGVLNVYRAGSWVPFSAAEAAVVERFAAVASLALRRVAPAQPEGSTSRTAAWAAATRATGTR